MTDEHIVCICRYEGSGSNETRVADPNCKYHKGS